MPLQNRSSTLAHLRENPAVDVLIIGAGINGIGTFRDLALQGVNALIIDRGDFCSGASAASSHMIHGGIRYLENGEFRLVREAVRERNLLIRNAPHLAHPLPTVIPIFRTFSGLLNAPLKFLGLLDRPAERGLLVIKIGLTLYDAYTRAHQVAPGHSITWKKESLAKYPGLNPAVLCTASYYDGGMPAPERICIDLLYDALAAHDGAQALNYVAAVGGSGDRVSLHDAVGGETFEVRPGVVVNASGPWIDLTNRALGQETRFIGGTKGSHLVLDHPRLRALIGENEFFFENRDGRIVLIYPLGTRVLIGTSDIAVDDPDEARLTDDEIDYFFSMIDKVFPGLKLDRSQIVFAFTGVRPLPPAGDVSHAGQISRDHSIKVLEPGDKLDFPVLNLIGGKWTTFRAFSEGAADAVLRRLGAGRRVSTELIPIGGGRDFPATPAARAAWVEQAAGDLGLAPERVEGLLDRYGTRAREIGAFLAAGDDAPLEAHPGYSRREIAYLAGQEAVIHLDDLILRRTLIGMLGDLTPALLDELAGVVGESLGWSAAERKAEAEGVAALFADRFWPLRGD